jgi:DNA-binding CsgD family transcriptional regulator
LLRWLQGRTERPLLLVVDDLHWADVDSLHLLAFLARRVTGLRVAIIAATRLWPTDAGNLLRGLTVAGHGSIERLAPLSRNAVVALLSDHLGTPVPERRALWAWEMCGGNPLLVNELAAAFERGDGPTDRVDRAVPLAEYLLLARFAGVSEAGLRCARAASVLGASFPADVAAEIAALDEDEIDGALDALFRSGLIAGTADGRLRFVHPLFAQALADDLAPPVRRRLHSRAFAALAHRNMDDQAAEQAVRADLAGDDLAVEILERVGRAALAAGAVGSAAQNLEAAVRFGGARASTSLRLALGEALTRSGRVEEAARVCRSALTQDELPWRDRVQTLRMLGRASYLTGAVDFGDGVFGEAIEIAVSNEPAAAIEPLLDRSLAAWLAGGPAMAVPFAERARDIARTAAAPELRDRADATWGHLALDAGDPRGLEITERMAVRLDGEDATRLLDPADLTWPWAPVFQIAMNANHAERLADGERIFRRARAVVEEAGAANALGTLAIYIANNLIRQGRLEEALEEADCAEEFSELTPGVLAYARVARAEALLWLGRLDQSRDAALEALRLAPDQWFARIWVGHVCGLRRLWAGEEGAAEQFLEIEALARENGIGEPCQTQWAGHAVQAHLLADRPADAIRVIAWLEQCGASLTCRWPRFAAALARARLAYYRGDHPSADEEFRAAIALIADVPLPLQHAEAQIAYGEFLRRCGRIADARPHLARAGDLAGACSAAWLADHARDELRLARGRRRRPAEDRNGLTVAEQRVAELAAAGRTNAEIARQLYLSVNTVQSHLKHVYSKLGVSSRHELAALPPQSQAFPPPEARGKNH